MTEELDIASYMKALTRRLKRGTLLISSFFRKNFCRCDIAIISYTRSCYIYLNNLTILYTTSNYCSRSIPCMPGQQFLKESEAYKNFINRIDSGATKNTKGSSLQKKLDDSIRSSLLTNWRYLWFIIVSYPLQYNYLY